MLKAKSTQLRKKLIAACMAKQRSLINDFHERITALTETQGLGNDESYDNTDLARKSANMEEINSINRQLQFAIQEMNVLEQLQTTEDSDRDTASPGAIVVTNLATFFISVSIEKFNVDGKTYIGISTQSPIFGQMNSKRKGDSFHYHDKVYVIKDVI